MVSSETLSNQQSWRRAVLKRLGFTAPFLAFSAKAAEPSPDKLLMDRLAIREVIDNWVLYRDAGDWERFRTVWHSDGYMMATWFEGPATEFAKVSSEGMNHGVNIMHFLGGTTIDLAGNRAVAQTKMTLATSPRS
jgi:SnoaL-like domain